MATGTILLPIGGATLADGSSNNAAPELRQISGSEASPRKSLLALSFAPLALEHVWWTFQLPSSYGSAPLVRLQWTTTAATATYCIWGVRLAAISPGDADTPYEHPAAALHTTRTAVNTAEAQRLTTTTVQLTNTDGAAAGDLVFLHLSRRGTDGLDTLAVDADLLSATFEFTTA